MPGVNPLNLNTYIQVLGAQLGLAAVDVPGANLVGVEEVKREPALGCYALAAGCKS